MKNRTKQYKVSFIAGALIMALTILSCEKYLDKAPGASITDKDVFGNFRSFQGFVEELYAAVIDYGKAHSTLQVQYADESLSAAGPLAYDQGNYWSQPYLMGTGVQTLNTQASSFATFLWPNAWYAIRKANLALSKLDVLTDATQEEKDLIKGQALFFRGYFYFEVMKWWGGMPYMDKPLAATDIFALPRLNYRETSLKAAADLRAAADLLPADWDQTTAGKATLGNNRQRASKVMALSFLSKVLLYAASPMMNEESTGNNAYDAELCKQSAAAAAEALSLCDQASSVFKMQTWATWTDNFWVDSPSNNKMSGGTEAIMLPTVRERGDCHWAFVFQYTLFGMGGYGSMVETPTHNFVKSYYMANGLPITDPASGYNPNDPWTGREPRFYKDITIDGEKLVNSSLAGADQFAQLYTGGRHRGGQNGSQTGYAMKRWAPQGCNNWDLRWNNFQAYYPHMRVAEVYLMYAEAVVNGYGTPQSSVPGSITAESAVNVVRNRAQLPNLISTYTASKDAFMADLRQERQIELAWDVSRFHDLRRWNLNSVYKDKTAIDFDRGTNGKPINLVERVVITRTADKKHNWLPLPVSLTKIYPEFAQNPGW
jgi:starch-binding outer membrane protein, SusD/RagB family